MRKIAIVTGASSGIGAATALALCDRGTDSIITYGNNRQGAVDVAAEVGRRGGKAVPLPLDVGASSGFAAFRDQVSAALRQEWDRDRLDYLVNNAGFGEMALFEDMTEERFDILSNVTLRGPYFLTQRLLPLLADGGAIVNVASSSALTTEAETGYSAYASLKAAMIVLTRYLAKELGKRRIRVNSVAPGPTRTRIGNDAFDRFPEVIAPLVERTALGRLGEPDDVGAVIAALLSDEFRWVTAQNLEVSGGFKL